MGGSFFDTLSVKEKQSIKQKTDGLISLMEKWAARYSLIRTVRIPSLALNTAIMVPRMDIPESFLLARMILWIFGIDDISDERIVTFEEFQHKAEQWHLIARHGSGGEMDDRDEATIIFLEIREELSKAHLFEPLYEYWSFHVHRLVEGMTREYWYGLQYRAYGNIPALDELLSNTRFSVGFPVSAFTALALMNDPSVLENLELINEAIQYAGAAIRLYNDVKSLEKEIQEDTVNSVMIAHAMLGVDTGAVKERNWTEAKQYIWQLADSYAQRSCDLLERIQTESGQIEETIAQTLAFSAYFYSEHDYHITLLPKVYEMLSASAQLDKSRI